MRWTKWRLFGFSPLDMPAHIYNTLSSIAGWLLIGGFTKQTLGAIMVTEAVLVSIERCWPKAERPE